jgi:thioredoxin reductase (NADPH)
VKNSEKFEGKYLFYSVKNKKTFKNKKIAIFGGGDSSLDWTLELSKTSKVILIHRRSEFRGSQSTFQKIKKLSKSKKIIIKTPFQLESIEGENKIQSINIKDEDGKIENLKVDNILGFFGLIMQLGPIAEWGLNLNKKHIPVNTENFETEKKGIFAIGDICEYPGKLKLILSGFHEAALAARGCFKYARPDEKYRFEFSTTSKSTQERLGIKKK